MENNAVAGLDGDDDPVDRVLQTEAGGMPSRLVIDDDGQFRMTRILSHGAASYRWTKPAVKTGVQMTAVSITSVPCCFHYPNTWNHWMGDHAISFQMLPLGRTDSGWCLKTP